MRCSEEYILMGLPEIVFGGAFPSLLILKTPGKIRGRWRGNPVENAWVVG